MYTNTMNLRKQEPGGTKGFVTCLQYDYKDIILGLGIKRGEGG
jgi:hypothetical protein